jgi:5-methylcytosine-specific restriction protein A
MGLRAAFTRVLGEYESAHTDDMTGHALADYIRTGLPEAIASVVGANDRYKIEGSPGKGNWAHVPWVAVFDRFVTETALRVGDRRWTLA